MQLAEQAAQRAELLARAEALANADAAFVAEAASFGDAVAAVKAGDEPARVDLCAGLLFAGFCQPMAIVPVYDSLATAWLGNSGPAHRAISQSKVSKAADPAFTAEFWQALWQLLDDSGKVDALSLTARVAALGGVLDPQFGELAEAHSHSHPGAAEPQKRRPPPMIDLAELARPPADSLAGQLQSMLADNGYDAEVLDRQALGLSQLPPGLCYLNTRILQMHDVWHLVAGYRTTSLHEIAISAFQLAQFGHNYSAMFLAVVLTIASTTRPEGLPILLQIISEAWRHGRTNPSFMAIEWEHEWHKSIDQIRAEQGIVAFKSALPADLFETLAQANPD